jgi:transposase
MILQHFFANGMQYVDKRVNNGARLPVTEAQIKEFTTNAMLVEMAGWSIKRRAERFSEIVGCRITKEWLRNKFKEYGLSFRKVQTHYYGMYNNGIQASRLRTMAALQIATIIAKGEPYISFDETTVHVWLKLAKAWQNKT